MNLLFLTISHLYDLAESDMYADLMREFVKNNHSVYIVAPFERRAGKETRLYESGGAHILGVKILNIQKTNIIEKGICTLLIEYQYMNAIKKYLGDVRFDVVTYSTPPITFNKVIEWAKKEHGAKTYLQLKDIFPQNAVDIGMMSKTGVKGILYKMFRKMEVRMYELSDYIGCMSPANVDYVLKHNPSVPKEKVHINPNCLQNPAESGVSLSRDRSVLEQYGIPRNKKIFIYGGNLGKPQGLDFLLEVIGNHKDDKRLFFVVVGNGTEYEKIADSFEINQPKNAKLIQRLPIAKYDALVRGCDVGMIFLDKRFTIPNFPSRVLSYMEYSMPVIIATDVNSDMGPIAEDNGYGLWSESGDIEAFNKNVDKLLEDGVMEKMGKKGFAFLIDNYTIDKSYKIIIDYVS